MDRWGNPRGPKLSFANVVSLIALFVALGGGAYAITLNKNVVKSKHIAPNAAKGKDVAENTLGPVPNAINASRANSLSGLGPGSLTTGRSGTDQNCVLSVLGGGYVDCLTVNITLPRSQRLLLIATAEYAVETLDPPLGTTPSWALANCLIEVDDNGVFYGQRSFGSSDGPPSASHEHAVVGGPANMATTAVTAPISAGHHYVDLSCQEEDPTVTVLDSNLSVVAIGSD